MSEKYVWNLGFYSIRKITENLSFDDIVKYLARMDEQKWARILKRKLNTRNEIDREFIRLHSYYDEYGSNTTYRYNDYTSFDRTIAAIIKMIKEHSWFDSDDIERFIRMV